jgi:vacuolar-type H+-ATPase subunit H
MAAEMLKKVMATENEAAENEKNAASEADKIIKKAKDDAEKLLSEKECAVYEAAEIKKAKDTAEVIVTEAVKEAQRYADGLKKQSAEKLSEAVGIVKDTLLK